MSGGEFITLRALAVLLGWSFDLLENAVVRRELSSLDDPQWRYGTSPTGEKWRRERESCGDMRITREAVSTWLTASAINLPADSECSVWLQQKGK